MRFTSVDIQDVQRDLDTGVPTNFNTNFHTAEEAPDLPIPTEIPYSFERWLPLILESRGIPASDLQIVPLSRAQVGVLVKAASASIHTRVLNRSYEEDLRDDVYSAFNKLTFPPGGLFMRLAACSAKDGAQTTPGKVSLDSVDEIILQLTTSFRAWSALSNTLSRGAQEARLFFLPFDTRMRTEREYRVFCVPETLRITAVSQYKWHKPWIFAEKTPDEREHRAQTILDGISGVHSEIIARLHKPGEHEMDDLLRTQGFTFDVLYNEEAGVCALVELNTFGVRSACGSCLFQWVKDRSVLYGEESEDVEFRVVL